MIPLLQERVLMFRQFTLKYEDFAESLQILSGLLVTSIKVWIVVFI